MRLAHGVVNCVLRICPHFLMTAAPYYQAQFNRPAAATRSPCQEQVLSGLLQGSINT